MASRRSPARSFARRLVGRIRRHIAPLLALAVVLLFAKMDLAIGVEVPGWLNANLRLVLEVFGSVRSETPPSR